MGFSDIFKKSTPEQLASEVHLSQEVTKLKTEYEGKLNEINNGVVEEAEVIEENISKRDYVARLRYNPIFTWSYDGEKNPGEIGIIKRYNLDFPGLRARSWQSYLESEITQDVIHKFALWVIGSGLKLQSEPEKLLLKNAGISLNTSPFSKLIEAKFKVYTKSRESDYYKLDNINRLAKRAFIDATVGGDCLVILRMKKGKLDVQIVDGQNVVTPVLQSDQMKADLDSGHIVRNGIVTNKAGEQVAYYVRQDQTSWKRIKAKTKGGLYLQAFMVYGMRYRTNDNRGIPLISAVLETLKKLDRYKEATVGAAEETAKVAYYIKHGDNSTGESPLTQNIKAGLGLKEQNPALEDDGTQVANKIAATTGKQVFNLTPDADLKTLESKSELYFKDFYTTNINMVCAAIGIPPEVALSKYDSNFSASRAALKDWEHTINVNRENFSFSFYQNIYNFWFGSQVLANKITAPGYLTALLKGDTEIVEAYQSARFVGANVPHIDPVKEVMAERLKLGKMGENAPLTTVEAATEAVSGGDYDSNKEQFLEELTDVEVKEKVEVPPKVEKKK